jgi:hypothetical protein
MASMSFCCTDAWTVSVSVIVRFSTLGRLEGGGDVFAVVPLSFVGVLDELSDPVLSACRDCGRVSEVEVDRSCSEPRTAIGIGGGPRVVGDMRGVLSMGSGLADRGAKSLSKMLAFVVAAGPVNGPGGMAGCPFGRFPAPSRCAFDSRSNMFCVSTSPVTRACALAIPAFDETDQAIRSLINSMDRFSTFWRLCIRSSDWCANEKECSDSDGKRERSSVKVEVGPADRGAEWSSSMLADGDLVRTLSEGARLNVEVGMVGVRIGLCCWRMRRSPDIPRP